MIHYIKRSARRLCHSLGYDVRSIHYVPPGRDWLHDITRLLPLHDPPVIFDVGANVGRTVLQIKTRFPSAVVHAFEPISSTYDELVRRTESYADIHNNRTALGSQNDTVTVRCVPWSGRNSLVSDIFSDSDDATEQEITVGRLDEYARHHGIDYIDCIKTDTEGYDAEVLGGAEQYLAEGRIGAIYSEVCFVSDCNQHTSMDELRARVEPFNMCVAGFYDIACLQRGNWGELHCDVLFVNRNLWQLDNTNNTHGLLLPQHLPHQPQGTH